MGHSYHQSLPHCAKRHFLAWFLPVIIVIYQQLVSNSSTAYPFPRTVQGAQLRDIKTNRSACVLAMSVYKQRNMKDENNLHAQ